MATITAEFPSVTSAPDKSRDRVLLAGIALTSFAALLLELALTRLFSVVLFGAEGSGLFLQLLGKTKLW